MSVFHEQRICVKFYVKIGKSVTVTFEMLKIAFGEEAMCRTQTYEWWKCFTEGRNLVDDDQRSGQPSTSKTDDNAAKVREVICSDRHLTVREVAEEKSILKTVCHEIFTENLGMHRILAKFVPHLLTDDQKQNRVDVSQELLNRANGDDNFRKTLLQEMRLGCICTMSKRKSIHYSGCRKLRRNQKKHAKCFHTSR